MNKAVLFSSKREDWRTPKDLFTDLDREFGFTLDVAASDSNALCSSYFTREDNGLVQPWAPHTCWCNPPYGRTLGAWLHKAQQEAEAAASVVVLIPARTDTRWFHDYVLGSASEIRFLKGRLKFDDGDDPAPFPSMLVIYRPPRWQLSLLRGMAWDKKKGRWYA